MRSLIPLALTTPLATALTTVPALAHTGVHPHLHEGQAFWIAAGVFAFALGLTLIGLRTAARAAA